ncbi:MAG: CHAP domain-containing protein [Candidatus Doudnabacteria bacterium]
MKKLHIDSFPAIHIKHMDWMDFLFKFSGELLVLILAIVVSGMNWHFFSGKNYHDNSLAGSFLSNHSEMNRKLFAKNSSIVTLVSKNSFVPQAQAENFVGLDSQGLTGTRDLPDNQDIILGDETTILAPNPDSIQSLIAKQIKIYQTQPNDSLPSIANSFGVSQQTIMWANKLTSSNIKPGWYLIILPTDGVLAIADSNTTLPDLAAQFNPERYNKDKNVRDAASDALLNKIISYNSLANAEDIEAGQYIIIPGGKITEAPKPAQPKPKVKNPIKRDDSEDITSQGSGYDGTGHLFPKGYCTYYVATKTKITFGGNAKNWLSNAKASGYVTGKEPAPRSVVVTTDNLRYGHVAYVEKVEGNRILVSEMNFEKFNRVNQRWISIDSRTIRGYIYP